MGKDSTPTVESGPPATSTRTMRKALRDLVDGALQRRVWAHLGWQDIKRLYRRSFIGPLWITLSTGVTVTALGLLFSSLLGASDENFFPYLAVGFIVWQFIVGCLTESTEAYTANEGLLKQVPAPVSVHAYRLVWRQALMFAHSLLIYVVVLAIFPMPVSWTVITAVPAMLLLAVNGVWVALLFGIVATRFRDIHPIIATASTLLFYVTPIVWDAKILQERVDDWRSHIADWNPLFHYIEILRDPLIGENQLLSHWLVVLGCTIAGWLLTLLVLRNYRARVPYWV